MRFFILLLFLDFSLIASAEDSVDKFQQNRWHKLMKAVNREILLIEKVKKKSAQLEYRLLELYTEKIGLIKTKENNSYLSSSPKKRDQFGRDYFFRESKKLNIKVERFGINILSKYPHFRSRPDVYYTLALNSRDYGDNNQTEKYLLRALAEQSISKGTQYNAWTSLGDHYYNEKQYEKAIKYYNYALKRPGDEWYTKHLFNNAWCYFKIKKHTKAIELLKLSYTESLTKKYIDMSEQIFNSVGLFHIHAGKIPEGVLFYLKNVNDPSEYLIKMSKSTTENGDYKETLLVLNSGLKKSIRYKQKESIGNYQLEYLNVYKQFKKFSNFYNTSIKLLKMKRSKQLNDSQTLDAIEKIKEIVGLHQLTLTRNGKIKIKDFDPKLLKRVISYFNILIGLDPKDRSNYEYLQGETFFSLSKYKDAIIYYKKSFETIEKNSKNNLKQVVKDDKSRKNIDAILSSLEKVELTKKSRDYELEYAYNKFITYWPQDQNSSKIFENLYALYFTNKKYVEAVEVIKKFNQHYKESVNLQRKMLTSVIDIRIKEKNTPRVNYWIKQMRSGYLSFEKSYIDKAEVILANLLFEDFDKLSKNGKNSEAIVGYKKIFDDERYPKSVKAKAAYNSSILYLKINETSKSSSWLKTALSYFSSKEVNEIRSDLNSMSIRYFKLQDFENSIKLTKFLLERYCNEKYDLKNEIFERYHSLNLVISDHNEIFNSFKFLDKCSLPNTLISDLYHKTLLHYADGLDSDNMIKLYDHFKSRFQQYNTEYFVTYFEIYKINKYNGEESKKKKIQKLLDSLVQSHFNIENKSINQYLTYKDFENFSENIPKQLNFKLYSLPSNKDFDENHYNKSLEEKFQLLKDISNTSNRFISSGDPEQILRSYEILISFYEELKKQIENFTPPKMPKEYITGFKGAMKQVIHNLDKEIKSFNTISESILKDTDIMAINHTILQKNQLIKKINHRYPASLKTGTIDLVGANK